jgi:DNA-binding NtrC family response regulator
LEEITASASVPALRRTSHLPSDEELSELFSQFGLVARSRSMEPVLRYSWKAARVNDAALLIDGETGTGKQVLAQAIHGLDEKRSRHPFVTVHCGNHSGERRRKRIVRP